jgi:DNA (cytosine-5)-methyltransferase 1
MCPARVTTARKPVLRRSPYAGMLFNGQGRPLNLDAPAPTLPATMGGNRTPIIDQEQLDDGSDPWVVDYHHRLWHERKKPLRRVPSRLRRLTTEEAAAIQTFPLDMKWEGTLSQQFRQIGNAVPPTLAYHVAAAIRHALQQDVADGTTVTEALQLVA